MDVAALGTKPARGSNLSLAERGLARLTRGLAMQVPVRSSRAGRGLMPDEPNSGGSSIQAPAGTGGAPAASAVRDDLRALRAVVEGTAGGTGQEFFRSRGYSALIPTANPASRDVR